jgi:hypothetical protein
MTYFKHMAELNESEKLEVTLRYRKDHGVSWYHGHAYKRGLVLDFTPCTVEARNGYLCKTTLLGDNRGRIIFLEEWNRKSDKKGREVAAFVEANIDRLVAAGAQQDWDAVIQIVREHYT